MRTLLCLLQNDFSAVLVVGCVYLYSGTKRVQKRIIYNIVLVSQCSSNFLMRPFTHDHRHSRWLSPFVPPQTDRSGLAWIRAAVPFIVPTVHAGCGINARRNSMREFLSLVRPPYALLLLTWFNAHRTRCVSWLWRHSQEDNTSGLTVGRVS